MPIQVPRVIEALVNGVARLFLGLGSHGFWGRGVGGGGVLPLLHVLWVQETGSWSLEKISATTDSYNENAYMTN